MLICRILGHKYIKDGIRYSCSRCAEIADTVMDMNIDFVKFADAIIKTDKSITEMRLSINALNKRISDLADCQGKVAEDIEKLKRTYNQLVEFLESKG